LWHLKERNILARIDMTPQPQCHGFGLELMAPTLPIRRALKRGFEVLCVGR
jgi:hypothetical protein